MGNNKIGITAEFVSIIRSKDDPKNLYFVSPKTKRIYNFAKRLFSENKLKDIFDWRLKLSQIIDEKVSAYKPEQILELGCGYSLRGFNLCLQNSDLVYIDSDLENLVTKKRQVIKEICKTENMIVPVNYHLISINVLGNNFFEKIKDLLLTNKKTLIIAEGLTSYFSNEEFEIFLKNIKSFLKNFSNAEFYSHESLSRPKGIAYKILRSFVSLITRTKNPRQFKSATEFKDYLGKINVSDVTVDTKNPSFLFYSIS